MTTTMTGVARMMTSALAGSANLAGQQSIEASIMDDIQKVQMIDSNLTQHKVNLETACLNPSVVLANTIEAEPNELHDDVTRIINTDDADLAVVTYSFENPQIGVTQEHRVIELNPNFAAHCYDTK